MYKIFLFIAAISIIGCRAEKETLQKAVQVDKVDSLNDSFKQRLNLETVKQGNADITVTEYEYPEQTPEEKKEGTPAKPRIKKQTVAHLQHTETTKGQQQVDAGHHQVINTAVKKQAAKSTEVKPGFNWRLPLLILFIVIAVALGLIYKFSLGGRIMAFLKKLF